MGPNPGNNPKNVGDADSPPRSLRLPDECAVRELAAKHERVRVDVLEAYGGRELPRRLEKAREVDPGRPIERRQEVSVVGDRLLLRRVRRVEYRFREREIVQVIREPERVRPREPADLDRRIEARAGLSRALIELDAVDADAIEVRPVGVQRAAGLVDVQ